MTDLVISAIRTENDKTVPESWLLLSACKDYILIDCAYRNKGAAFINLQFGAGFKNQCDAGVHDEFAASFNKDIIGNQIAALSQCLLSNDIFGEFTGTFAVENREGRLILYADFNTIGTTET